MWPFKKKLKAKNIHPNRIVWRYTVGQSRADCSFCKREITQEETDITYYSHSGGDRRAYGTIWCNICGAVQKFDTRENYS